MITESTTTTRAADEPRTSNEIRSEIRRTRGRMDETLDELGDRLTVRSIMNTALDWFEAREGRGGAAADRAKSAASNAGKKTARTVARTVKEHPMPSALVGAGLAWMIVEALSEDEEDDFYIEEIDLEYEPVGYTASSAAMPGEYDYVQAGSGSTEPGMMEKAREKAEHAKEAVTGAVGAAKDKLSDAKYAARRAKMQARERARATYGRGRAMSHDVGERLHQGYETGMERMHHGYETTAARFERATHESPLAVGLGFAALGILAGILLPRTRREDELIGERSDEFVDAVKEKGQDLLERGKEVGARVAETAMQEAERQGLTSETIGQKASELASKVGEVVKKTKEEAKVAAKDEGLTSQNRKSEASSSAETMKESIRPASEQRF